MVMLTLRVENGMSEYLGRFYYGCLSHFSHHDVCTLTGKTFEKLNEACEGKKKKTTVAA